MDAYNRYLLRSSGERQHQPQNAGESTVFALLDTLKEHGLLDRVLTNDERKNSLVVDDMIAGTLVVLDRWNLAA